MRDGEPDPAEDAVIYANGNSQGVDIDLIAKNKLEDFAEFITAFEQSSTTFVRNKGVTLDDEKDCLKFQ